MLSERGELLATLTPEPDVDLALRRAQYLAQSAGRDVAVARELVRRKLAGQRATTAAHPELPDRQRALDALDMALPWLAMDPAPPYLSTLDGVRVYEGRCARAYFQAWVGLPIRWQERAARRIPPHWRQVGSRTSPLAGDRNARHAVNPAHSLLNYAYAVLESQVRQALVCRGFDVHVGTLHADTTKGSVRDSLVYDLMELERPRVDDLLLTFLRRTTFGAGDFVLTKEGWCRLHPQLARAVVAACRVPQARLDAHAQWLASTLLG
jgi:CRISPR-associated endonuclease Cas1